MDTIKYYETEIGRIRLGNKLGSLLANKLSAASGDGRRKGVRQAKEDSERLVEGLKELQYLYYKATGECDLDLVA